MKALFDLMVQNVNNQPEKFFMNPHNYHGRNFVLFDYSMVSIHNFSSVEARESRGSVFEIDDNGNYVDVVVLPFPKFFNTSEFSMELAKETLEDLQVEFEFDGPVIDQEIEHIYDKIDGSIISAFDHDNTIALKSSSSFNNEFIDNAMDILIDDPSYYDKVLDLVNKRFNVMFEYQSSNPRLQVVIKHPKEKLTVLAVRNKDTGEYWEHEDLVEYFGEFNVVKKLDLPANWNYDVSDWTEREGAVIQYKNGMLAKIKCDWYNKRHRSLDLIQRSPKYIWLAYLNQTLDDYDVTSMNEVTKNYFEGIVKKCDDTYTAVVQEGIRYYKDNKDKSAGEYFRKPDIKYNPSIVIARKLYEGGSISECTEQLIKELSKHNKLRDLGVLEWKM